MASSLKLKKREKYHPPLDDSEKQQNYDAEKNKQQDNMNLNNTKRTYADVTNKLRTPKERNIQDKIDYKNKGS